MSGRTRLFRMTVASLVFLLAWQVIGSLTSQSTLPTLLNVLEQTWVILTQQGPYGHSALYHLQTSIVRVAVVTAIGLSIAILVGILMGIDERAEAVVSNWLPFWMTFPTLIVVFITMVMFRFSEMSIVVAVVFAATPYAITNTWEGTRAIDRDLLEMAGAFDVSQFDVWRHIYLPFLGSYIFGSFRYLFSMAWKIVVLAETFGVQDGMGAMFRFYFGFGEIVMLLAYLMLFIVVMMVVQYGLIPVENRIFAWRESA